MSNPPSRSGESADSHPNYGPCDGFGPDGQCSECVPWPDYPEAEEGYVGPTYAESVARGKAFEAALSPRERAPDEADAQLVEELIADAMRPYAAFFLLHKDGAKAKLLARLAALTSEGARLRKALEEAEKDTARLDWMNEHGASVDVEDLEDMPVTVQASDDYRIKGHHRHYDIRKAIDAAMRAAAAPSPDETSDHA